MAIVPAVATHADEAVSTDSATWGNTTTDYDSQSDIDSARTTFGDIYFGVTTYSGSYVVGGTNAETDAAKGIVITDGGEGTSEFSGTISGVGVFAVLFGSSSTSTYNFSGDVSGFSGKFYVAPITGTTTLNFSGTTESATSALAGTGSLYSTQSVTFSTAGYNSAATVANSSISANTLTFSGSANYTVNSSLSGADSSSTLEFSGQGSTTLNGAISNFATISFAGNSDNKVTFSSAEDSDFSSSTFAFNSTGKTVVSANISNLKSITMGHTGEVEIVSGSNIVADTFVIEMRSSNNNRFLTLDEGATITTGSFTRALVSVLKFTIDGTLTVTNSYNGNSDFGTGMMTIGSSSNSFTSAQTISGSGTLNAYGVSYYGSANLIISVANFNIGEGGVTRAGSTGRLQLGDTTIGLYNATSAEISAPVLLNGTETGTTFNPGSGEALTISGAVSGTGALAKTGEGTLTLSGANTYTGATTISAGTVVATNSSALGTNEVTIDGGNLTISGEDVTVANAISVVLDSYVVADTISLADDAGASTTVSYAIVVEDGAALGNDTTISVSASEEFLSTLAVGVAYNFAIVSGSDLVSFDYSKLADAGYKVVSAGGVITLTAPEPSMFGLLAGLGAIGLVAARRRRRGQVQSIICS